MTPEEKTIVRALVAVAWVDGEMLAPEASIIEGLMADFDASPEETAELLEFAKTPRTLREVDASALTDDEKYTLLRHATMLVCSDGVETDAEVQLLMELGKILDVGSDETREVVRSVRGGVDPVMERGAEEHD
jgi:uncharacterized membrane protein YebE (DUF533 family)